MKTIYLKLALYLILLIRQFPAYASGEEVKSKDDVRLLIDTHASEIAAAVACKGYMDGGAVRTNLALTKTEDALKRATNNAEVAKHLTEQIHQSIIESQFDKQFKEQFDEISADTSMRIAKCAQLVAGHAERATEIDRQLGIQ
ncbi:hypothetical protein [Photorhabdus luminescens]|uniref:Uncharacterized protein n=1 Tax=Photorhabdus luminescens subsp. mexicana TaxID=2100167 RepID=A0A4R4IPP2_PHOLU|nr:hypothetical protein [Photorhabdus luminescens]TDB42554.1 hypothetical protein C5468_24965 [Photorhabdus luminescens subsp. mexicana]